MTVYTKDYLKKPTDHISILDICFEDMIILNDLVERNKLTEHQRVALKRLISAYYNSF